MTRLTLPSSSIRPALFCSRPAVSISTTSSLALGALPDGVERDAGRVAALGTADGRRPDPLAPGLQLVGGGGAEGVGRAEQRRSGPSATSTRASLPTVVVLPVPLTPTTRTTAGRARRGVASQRPVERRGRPGASSSSRSIARDVVGVRVPSDLDPGAQPLDQLLGRRRRRGRPSAGSPRSPPRSPRRAVAGEQREQPAPERALRARQPGAQPDQAAGAGLGALEPGSPRSGASTSGRVDLGRCRAGARARCSGSVSVGAPAPRRPRRREPTSDVAAMTPSNEDGRGDDQDQGEGLHDGVSLPERRPGARSGRGSEPGRRTAGAGQPLLRASVGEGAGPPAYLPLGELELARHPTGLLRGGQHTERRCLAGVHLVGDRGDGRCDPRRAARGLLVVEERGDAA